MRCVAIVLVLLVASAALAQDPTLRQQNPSTIVGVPAPTGTPSSCTTSTGASGTELVIDGGFEGGTPNSNWNEASTNFGTPICDVLGCKTGGGTGPYAGNFWAWFGGIPLPETGSVDQTVTIPPGTATLELSFWLEVPVCASSTADDFVRAEIDGNQVFEYNCSQGVLAPYAQQFVDVSAFANGSSRTLTFTGSITGSPGSSNFFVDNVSLCAVAGSDIPEPAAPVPTLNHYGLILLSLLVLGLGGVLLRRAG